MPCAPALSKATFKSAPPKSYGPEAQRYRLFNALLILLIRLAMPPACILLASASSKALCVTLASSKSLKLLPILGAPSLSFPYAPFSSAVLLGLSVPTNFPLPPAPEDESDVWLAWTFSFPRLGLCMFVGLRPLVIFLGSPRRVAMDSWWAAGPEEVKGRNGGSSSSSSEAVKRGRRSRRDCTGAPEEEDEVVLEEGDGRAGSAVVEGRGLGERERRFD